MSDTVVVKLGGSTLQDPAVVDLVTGDILQAQSAGHSLIVVHGGGPAINEELTRRGITWSFFEGQRITSPEMMEVIDMVLMGVVNRKLVRSLNHLGCAAVGFSGVDHSTLVCRKSDNRLGQVGTIENVNVAWIRQLLNTKTVPVIAPIGFGNDGSTFNINADWAATHIASHMQASKLVFLTDQDGILDGSKKLISQTDVQGLLRLIETGVVAGGMLAKTRAVIHALENRVRSVHIVNARKPQGLLEILAGHKAGTSCLTSPTTGQGVSP
jgi:acetylglutamate kinase